jgi:hypothetical protein
MPGTNPTSPLFPDISALRPVIRRQRPEKKNRDSDPRAVWLNPFPVEHREHLARTFQHLLENKRVYGESIPNIYTELLSSGLESIQKSVERIKTDFLIENSSNNPQQTREEEQEEQAKLIVQFNKMIAPIRKIAAQIWSEFPEDIFDCFNEKNEDLQLKFSTMTRGDTVKSVISYVNSCIKISHTKWYEFGIDNIDKSSKKYLDAMLEDIAKSLQKLN